MPSILRRRLPIAAAFFLLVASGALRAQIAVNFSTADAGVTKSIPHWGLDTNWASLDNMRRGLSFMGAANVNVVRVPAMVDKPEDSGLTSDQKAHLDECRSLAAMVGPAAKWDLCAPGSDTVNAWFQSGAGTVNVDRWVQALTLNQRYYDHPLWLVEPFNEPDYANWGEGSMQNLSDIMTALQKAPEFSGAAMAGGSTMSTDRAAAWFDGLGGRASVGTTHCLYGTVANYVDFIQHVAAASAVPIDPEGHNVVEAIIGAEYGLQGMIWWGTAELARGDFVQASQGVRLGYAEDRANWTAAAVYRAPSGVIQAFLGSSERVGGSTTYRLHATDRDVYFDGHGPQRDYTVTIARNQERVITISVGPDAPPPIGGRYAVMNAGSGLCLEVAGGSLDQGAALQQNAFTGAPQQLWDVSPLPANGIGDLSYFHLANAKSGFYADVPAWVYDDETVIKQYNYPDNAVEHWYFEYVGHGCFAIRSRWSNKCLSVSAAGSALGAAVVQRTYTGTPDQLWRLEDPATTPPAVALAITQSPQSATAAPGQTITFAAAAAGTGKLSYQWQFNDVAIAGATDARLVLSDVQAANAGSYAVTITDATGTTLTSAAATLTLDATADVGRLTNLSIRSTAGTADKTLIAGFVIGGPAGDKTVLIRGIGPTLANYGVTGALAAPELDLYRDKTLLQSGAAWGGSATLAAAFDATSAFPLDPASDDAALLPTLPAGAYTAQVSGRNGTTGVALVELYDATAGAFDNATTPRLLNASARTQVGTGDEVLIAGFAIGGSTARTVLIRGSGPALAAYGVSGTLAQPKLELIHNKTVIASNTAWGGDTQITTVGDRVGAFPLVNPSSKDSALLVTLSPGTYSAKLSGADGGTGVGLVEVYDVP